MFMVLNANVYYHSLWECFKRFHCSFEWHLTPHLTLSIDTCIRRTPHIKWTQQYSLKASALYRFHCMLTPSNLFSSDIIAWRLYGNNSIYFLHKVLLITQSSLQELKFFILDQSLQLWQLCPTKCVNFPERQLIKRNHFSTQIPAIRSGGHCYSGYH